MPENLLEYQIGNYGGTLRTVTATVGVDSSIFCCLNEPLLNTPGILGEEFTGNVLKGYEMSEDEKEFIFYMREGLKWSDGELVTTEDIEFTIKDVMPNPEVTPLAPTMMQAVVPD